MGYYTMDDSAKHVDRSGAHSPNKGRALNSTAYRIYKILSWLLDGPLSVAEINHRFCQDAKIGKPLSSDSIWLYINTLKALGCEIRRPSPRNQFCYQLLSHPFGIHLSEAQFHLLSQVKAYAQEHWPHPDILKLDALLKKIVTHAVHLDGAYPNEGKSSKRDKGVEKLFSYSRSYDYSGSTQRLQLLEDAIANDTLLRVTYASPKKGLKGILFLPECIFYEQGVVYIRGERSDNPYPSNLRLERILHCDVYEAPRVQEQLKLQRAQYQEVRLRIVCDPQDNFETFPLQSHHGVSYIAATWHVDPNTQQRIGEMTLHIRETFYLEQCILSAGVPVEIITPDGLRERLKGKLRGMRLLYQRQSLPYTFSMQPGTANATAACSATSSRDDESPA